MRADIGDPDDREKMAAFARVLHQFCAVRTNEGWGIGVGVTEYRIGDQNINVFSDSWSVDIEGPDALVRGIQEAMRLEGAGPTDGAGMRNTGPTPR
jgi:hypothetical protein